MYILSKKRAQKSLVIVPLFQSRFSNTYPGGGVLQKYIATWSIHIFELIWGANAR